MKRSSIRCTDRPPAFILCGIPDPARTEGAVDLAIWGAATVLCVLAAILSRRFSPLAALVVFPALASLASGFGLRTSSFVVAGIQNLAPVIAMFLFAILFFGILSDAGMIAPLIRILLRAIGKRPSRIVPGTLLLALLLHLDGSGAVVFLIALPALLPLYQEAKQLVAALPAVSFAHVPRSQNHRADALANEAMDAGSQPRAPHP